MNEMLDNYLQNFANGIIANYGIKQIVYHWTDTVSQKI